MSQTNYTPIALYNSTTAAAVPVAGNLVNGELAVNITDGKLYYKDNLGAVKLLASNAAAGGTFAAPVVIEGTTTDADIDAACIPAVPSSPFHKIVPRLSPLTTTPPKVPIVALLDFPTCNRGAITSFDHRTAVTPEEAPVA